MKRLSVPDHCAQFDKDMMVASMAAKRAGEVVQNGYGKLHEIERKGVGDLVSEVDRECDKIVYDTLKDVFPNDDILSEELTPDTKEHGQRLWVVDPLDATSGFLFEAGDSISSVMISLRKEFETQLSIILFPLSGDWYYAKKGQGAYKNGVRLSTKNVTQTLNQAWVDMNHYGKASLETPLFSHLDKMLRSERGAALVTRGVPHSGVVTKIIEQRQKLAAVVHDNSPVKVKQAMWDIVPAQHLLEEAGGVMVNTQNKPINPHFPELIIAAGNREIASAICALLK